MFAMAWFIRSSWYEKKSSDLVFEKADEGLFRKVRFWRFGLNTRF